MDGLFRTDKEGNVQPALVSSYTVSEDKTTYTFKLRNAKWSNGETITAHDFAYTWKSSLHPNFPSSNAYHLYALKNGEKVKSGALPTSLLGVNAVADDTLVVKLEKPIPNFVEMTTHPIFYPIHAKSDRENKQWASDKDAYVCSGPFTIEAWKHDNIIIGKKNPNYWDASAVQLDTLEMVMVSEETEYAMYRGNELDWAGSPLSALPVDVLEQLREKDELKQEAFLGTRMLRVNTQHDLLKSKKIRQALSLALDRNTIAEHIGGDAKMAAHRYVPQAFELFDEPVMQTEGSPQELFVEGLTELEMTHKDMPPIELIYMSKDINSRLAQAIQMQWKDALGVEVTLRNLDGNVFFDTMAKHNYDLAMGSWIAEVVDPLNFLDVFRKKTLLTNNTHWENDLFAELVEQARTCFDESKRKALLKQSEEILLEESPIIPLTYYSLSYVNKSYVKDIVVTPLGMIDFKWARIQK